MKQDFTEQRFDYSGGRKDAPELTLTVGVSGCGKSTWAKAFVYADRGNTARFNRDDIRKMLFCDVPWNSFNENLVRNWQMEGARQALQMGKDVIIDDTNCVRNTRQKWEEFAQQQRVRFRIVQFTTDVKECIERDKKRGETCEKCGKPNGVMVGEGVIRKQQKDLSEVKVATKPVKEFKITRPFLERTELLKNGGFLPRLPGRPWVLVDVDGTLASFTDKTGKQLRGPFEEHKVLLDDPRPFVIEMVKTLYPHFNICIVSGRHDFCGDDTCDWLDAHGVPFDHILMRYSNDNRSDAIVKKEILEELQAVIGRAAGFFDENSESFAMPTYGIAFVLDDRPRVVRMWKENGICVIPVRGGTQHKEGCSYESKTGYRECPDCGALEDF